MATSPMKKAVDRAKLGAEIRAAAAGRKTMNQMGLSDNRGAIHPMERILNIARANLVHGIAHQSYIKHDMNIEGTVEAFAARKLGKRVDIEHMYPRRESAIAVCRMVEDGASNDALIDYVIQTGRAILLTPEQRAAVDAVPGNRSVYSADRLMKAGLTILREADVSAAGAN